jgi:hypothetical protein
MELQNTIKASWKASSAVVLGTIVSTSLSNEELSTVSERLIRAGIQLEQARAVAYLSRSPESPFADLVERGLASDTADLLPWSFFVNEMQMG